MLDISELSQEKWEALNEYYDRIRKFLFIVARGNKIVTPSDSFALFSWHSMTYCLHPITIGANASIKKRTVWQAEKY